MGKKKPKYERPTTKSQIRTAIRRLWLRSRERNKARATKKECVECGATEELEHHHKNPINWERIFRVLKEEILNDDTEALCEKCHEKKKEIAK